MWTKNKNKKAAMLDYKEAVMYWSDDNFFTVMTITNDHYFILFCIQCLVDDQLYQFFYVVF